MLRRFRFVAHTKTASTGYGNKGLRRPRELELKHMSKGDLARATIAGLCPLTADERRAVCAREGLRRLEDVALPDKYVFSDCDDSDLSDYDSA